MESGLWSVSMARINEPGSKVRAYCPLLKSLLDLRMTAVQTAANTIDDLDPYVTFESKIITNAKCSGRQRHKYNKSPQKSITQQSHKDKLAHVIRPMENQERHSSPDMLRLLGVIFTQYKT